ncbi:MAG: transcription antitermination factor NusB [Lachnospiraceae bacterium]|nr:transcription antitermination factor NusB [Lachnospiraceae bacterium]
MTRRMLREHLFKMLFRIEFHDDAELKEQYELYFQNSSANTEMITEVAANEEERKEIEDKLALIKLNLNEIDKKISDYAKDWDIDRIAKVELTILRIAVFEALFDDNVPLSVAINEAVVLAKKYSTPESATFINDILGKMTRDE